MAHPDDKPRPRVIHGRPFAHFQWNYGWGIWEQVSPKHAGRRGVVTAYPAATNRERPTPEVVAEGTHPGRLWEAKIPSPTPDGGEET